MQLGMIGLGRMGGNIVRRLDEDTAIPPLCTTKTPKRSPRLVADGATSVPNR